MARELTAQDTSCLAMTPDGSLLVGGYDATVSILDVNGTTIIYNSRLRRGTPGPGSDFKGGMSEPSWRHTAPGNA